MDKKTFGEQFKARREATGQTQATFAEHVRKTSTTVSTWESGRYLPTGSATQEIIDTLFGWPRGTLRECIKLGMDLPPVVDDGGDASSGARLDHLEERLAALEGQMTDLVRRLNPGTGLDARRAAQ